LAEYLDVHKIAFLLKNCDEFVVELLEQRGYPYRIENKLEVDLTALHAHGANVVINDVLDTTIDEVLAERHSGFKVVCIEDLGPGARHADWVVNALYPAPGIPDARLATGPRFATLRSEFHGLPPKEIREIPERILITFGGSDPGHLAPRVSRAIAGRTNCEILVIRGPAANEFTPPPGVEIRHAVNNMAQEMFRADLIVTAAGRTIYEAAAVGTPVIAIAQSAREATHAHLGLDGGVAFLGLGVLVSDDQIGETVERILADHRLRVELSERLRNSVDPYGAQRIAFQVEQLMRGL
jgi:spore coat polysaccharide biosynthesis predicted glycosyltransferase SpsG